MNRLLDGAKTVSGRHWFCTTSAYSQKPKKRSDQRLKKAAGVSWYDYQPRV